MEYNDDGYEVDMGRAKQQQRALRRSGTGATGTTREDSSRHRGPIDLDELFSDASILHDDDDDDSLFDEDDHALNDAFMEDSGRRYFSNPNKQLLDTDASLIPGSPFSKPPNKRSNRPTEPLSIAKYASTLAFVVTFCWVGSLFFFAIWVSFAL
jgi:hypothetical protein